MHTLWGVLLESLLLIGIALVTYIVSVSFIKNKTQTFISVFLFLLVLTIGFIVKGGYLFMKVDEQYQVLQECKERFTRESTQNNIYYFDSCSLDNDKFEILKIKRDISTYIWSTLFILLFFLFLFRKNIYALLDDNRNKTEKWIIIMCFCIIIYAMLIAYDTIYNSFELDCWFSYCPPKFISEADVEINAIIGSILIVILCIFFFFRKNKINGIQIESK